MRLLNALGQRVAHLAVVLEGPHGLERHGVDGLRPDQVLDVEHVAVGGVLRRRRRPEAALVARALALEERPPVARERLLPVLVRELRVRDGELALEIGPPRLLEPAVGLRVDTRHEEARNGYHRAGIAARCHEPLEAAQVRLDDGLVARQREDERHVDRAPLRDAVLDRAEPGLGARDLHVEVLPLDLLVEAHRLLEARDAVVRKPWVDLERDVPVDAVRALPHRRHEVAGVANVLLRERKEDLGRILGLARDRLQLLVVPVALGERLLEDRRVRGDADDGVLLHQPRQLAGLEHLARERVHPHTHSVRAQLVQPRCRHVRPSLSVVAEPFQLGDLLQP